MHSVKIHTCLSNEWRILSLKINHQFWVFAPKFEKWPMPWGPSQSMNWSSINCTAFMIEQSSLYIVRCTQPKILLLQFTKLETVWRYISIKNRHKAINILEHTNVLSLYTKNIKLILRWPKGSCKTYEIPFPKYFFS